MSLNYTEHIMLNFNYRDYKNMGLAGGMDLLGLSLVGAGSVAMHPTVYHYFPEFMAPISIAGALAALGGSMLVGKRIAENYAKSQTVLKSSFRINSDDPAFAWEKDKPLDGYLLGYCVDTGKPITITYDQATRHINIIGASGVGKTVLGRFLMYQQILAGGGLTFIDGKYNQADINLLYTFCCWAGRKHDFACINPGDPHLSNTYNPILDGDPDEVAARIMSLVPSTESSAGSDHYKQSGAQAVTVIVAALKKAKLAYSFIDLSILMTNEKALSHLEKTVHQKAPKSNEAINLSLFLEQYKTTTKPKEGPSISVIDVKKLKDTLGGLAGRMFSFGSGKFGEVTNHYSPEVRLFDAIVGQKIIYMPLPTMGKDIAATNFGKMELGDMRTSISWAQALPKNRQIWPPHLAFCDEIGSYATQSIARPFEQGRSANFCLVPAYQTPENLESVSSELVGIVNGNTATKIFFRTGTSTASKLFVDIVGMEDQPDYTITSGDTASASGSSNDAGLSKNQSDGKNVMMAQKIKQDYKISADEFQKLPIGEAIVLINGKEVHHIKIPFVELDKRAVKACGDVTFNRTSKHKAAGINLFQDADKYINFGKGGSNDDSDDEVSQMFADAGKKKKKVSSDIPFTTDDSV